MPLQSTAMACPLCSRRWTARWETAHISTCPGCGVPITVPPPSRDVASDGLFTEGAYGGRRIARRAQWLREARTRLSWIRAHVAEGRLLELGSATGEFVAVAEQGGYDVTGLEPSAWAAQASRDLTHRVVCADPEQWLPQHAGHFDAVVAFHTLEHVQEPESFLRALRDALAPGGLLFLELPNGGARDLRDGARWLHASLPDHVLHYREHDLRALCERVDLTVRSLECFTMKPFDPPAVWAARRARWLLRGEFSPSLDNLRVVAGRA